MNKLLMIGAGVVVLGGMAAAGGKMLDKQRAAAIAKFEITQEEFAMMDACEKAMTYNDIEFKSGAPEIAGCACMTRETLDRVLSQERELAAELLPALIVAVEKEADETLVDVEALFKKYKVSDSRADAISLISLNAVKKCSATDLYMTAEEKAEIAATKATKIAKSREAFDQLVKEGHMTREEANRRLASMQR